MSEPVAPTITKTGSRQIAVVSVLVVSTLVSLLGTVIRLSDSPVSDLIFVVGCGYGLLAFAFIVAGLTNTKGLGYPSYFISKQSPDLFRHVMFVPLVCLATAILLAGPLVPVTYWSWLALAYIPYTFVVLLISSGLIARSYGPPLGRPWVPNSLATSWYRLYWAQDKGLYWAAQDKEWRAGGKAAHPDSILGVTQIRRYEIATTKLREFIPGYVAVPTQDLCAKIWAMREMRMFINDLPAGAHGNQCDCTQCKCSPSYKKRKEVTAALDAQRKEMSDLADKIEALVVQQKLAHLTLPTAPPLLTAIEFLQTYTDGMLALEAGHEHEPEAPEVLSAGLLRLDPRTRGLDPRPRYYPPDPEQYK